MPPSVRPRRPRTASIVNLGCKVNQSEMEAAARLLRSNDVRIVGARARADLILVNTCTVTAVADQKSRQAVRRARRTSPDAEVVVTGCSVGVAAAGLAAADPAARLVDNTRKAALLDELARLAALPERPSALSGPLPTLSGAIPALAAGPTLGDATVGDPTAPVTALDRSGLERLASAIDGVADGPTVLDRTRAFVKVQDGCSFYCTYCIIPRARGPERSLEPDEVVQDVRRALAAGHREIVLTGINVGTYDGGASERGPRGSHRRSALTLGGLVRRILAETEVERIRLSSIEPQHVDDDLLEAWTAGAGRCLPHIHVPLQSGDDGVLRRMGRRYDTAGYLARVERIRSAIPEVAIHADVIAGFPTEDDAAHERTLAFLRTVRPAGLHVFRYSARPGTPATRMAGQVDERVRRARAAELLDLAAEARAAFAARRVGREARVLIETRLADGRWVGHAEDHVLVAVVASPNDDLSNTIVRVRPDRVDPGAADRLAGRALAVDRGPMRRPPLPLLATRGSAPVAGGAHG